MQNTAYTVGTGSGNFRRYSLSKASPSALAAYAAEVLFRSSARLWLNNTGSTILTTAIQANNGGAGVSIEEPPIDLTSN